jgi:hypothetical protein
MKKNVRTTLVLFFLSVFVNNFNRVFSSPEIITPFPFDKDVSISVAWYAKHICELLSFSLLMLCVCFILKPVEEHLKTVQWVGHNSLHTFVKVWHRIFWVVFLVSGLDLVHYILAFRHIEWFFLIQNGLFFLLTIFYLFKAYRK